jgi:hypothetical protein
MFAAPTYIVVRYKLGADCEGVTRMEGAGETRRIPAAEESWPGLAWPFAAAPHRVGCEKDERHDPNACVLCIPGSGRLFGCDVHLRRLEHSPCQGYRLPFRVCPAEEVALGGAGRPRHRVNNDVGKNTLPPRPGCTFPSGFRRGETVSFGISSSPITTDDEYLAATYSTPVQVTAGSLVEFRVTSFDVNHGFSVYSPSNRLIAQTQAMPGYVNRLANPFQRTRTIPRPVPGALRLGSSSHAGCV